MVIGFVLLEESLSQLTYRIGLLLSRFSCGESPRRSQSIPQLSYGKQPVLSMTVLVVDGENDLPAGSISFSVVFFSDDVPLN
jgi:hypothetical protein